MQGTGSKTGIPITVQNVFSASKQRKAALIYSLLANIHRLFGRWTTLVSGIIMTQHSYWIKKETWRLLTQPLSQEQSRSSSDTRSKLLSIIYGEKETAGKQGRKPKTSRANHQDDRQECEKQITITDNGLVSTSTLMESSNGTRRVPAEVTLKHCACFFTTSEHLLIPH